MVVLINLVGLAIVGGAGYALYAWADWLRNDKRILARQAAKLAREASQAAKHGEYAERDRLDEARSAVLTALAGRPTKANPSDHDDFNSRYM